MINLNLTNNEWYALHYHIERLLKQYPGNRILDSIMIKLAENHPTLTELKDDSFQREYHSQWINEGNNSMEEVFKDIEVNEDIMQLIILKFKVTPIMLRYVYDRVMELSKTYENIYVCMNIVENQILHEQHKANEIVRNYMRLENMSDGESNEK